jgi:hypothetical protein
MKKPIIISIGIIVIAAAIAAIILFVPKHVAAPVAQQPSNNNNQVAAATVNTAQAKMAPVPEGSQTYQIMQGPKAMPKIDQVTINPVDVHVGDTQTLTVVISDPDSITSVVATTRTDNGTTTIPLPFVGSVTVSGVSEQKYSASWTVKDTHVARYNTVFTATDAKGNVNSATMNWTDALCSWNGTNNYNGATWDANSTYGSGGCSFAPSETDGVENGSATIDAPITLGGSSTFVITSGHLTFSGAGQLSIPASAKIAFGGDMYCASSGWVTSFSNPADGTYQVARSALNNNVYPGQTGYFTTAVTTNYGQLTFNYNCGPTLVQQYVSNPPGSVSYQGGCTGPFTCGTPTWTSGYYTTPCGGQMTEAQDQGHIAACQNNGQPTGQMCDIVHQVTDAFYQGCY